MGALAVITARGGSKRIPKKNIRKFCGRPIISYPIQAALESGLFDEVMVSTDSGEIARIAMECGAEVPFFRSAGTSGDFASTSDVLLEVLDEYEKRGRYFETACCIYPAAPFVTVQRLAEAMGILADGDADTVMPVAAFSYPPQRGVVLRQDGSVTMAHPEYMDTRSQDLETVYHDCGQFYAFKVPGFQVNKSIMKGKIVPLIVPELQMQDIDNEADWELAELKYQLFIRKGQ